MWWTTEGIVVLHAAVPLCPPCSLPVLKQGQVQQVLQLEHIFRQVELPAGDLHELLPMPTRQAQTSTSNYDYF